MSIPKKSKAVGVKVVNKNNIRFVYEQGGELISADTMVTVQEEGGRFYTHMVTEGCSCQLCTSDKEAAGFKRDGDRLYLPEWANAQIRAKILEKRLTEALGKEGGDGEL